MAKCKMAIPGSRTKPWVEATEVIPQVFYVIEHEGKPGQLRFSITHYGTGRALTFFSSESIAVDVASALWQHMPDETKQLYSTSKNSAKCGKGMPDRLVRWLRECQEEQEVAAEIPGPKATYLSQGK